MTVQLNNDFGQEFNDLNIDVNTRQLEYLESDNLNIQCTNSSDFIVGKQTNFNGPVTIINCDFPDRHSVSSAESESKKIPEERIVIRDKVLTTCATSVVQNQAQKISLETPKIGSDHPPKTFKRPLKPKNHVFLVQFLAKDFLKIPVGAWCVIVAILIGVVIALSTYLLAKNAEVVDDPTDETGKSNRIIYSNGHSFNLFTKSDWGGLNESSSVKISLPVPYVVISHTAGRMCYEKQTCMEVVRAIQKYHLSRDFADIAYNFLVGGDGNIYEGRGWTNRSPIEGFANNRNIDINFVGDFSVYDNPTLPQFEAVQALLEYGINKTMVSENYSLIAANATYNTESPGKNVYKIIKNWPHFDPNPKDHIPDKKTINKD